MARPVDVSPNTVDLVALERRMTRVVQELKQGLARPSAPAAAKPGGWVPTPNLTRNDLGPFSPAARDTWEAANLVMGTRTGRAGGAPDDVLPVGALTAEDLDTLERLALRLLAQLVPPGVTQVPRSVLADLPDHVDAYWRSTFGPRSLAPQGRDAMVKFIRDAAEDLE